MDVQKMADTVLESVKGYVSRAVSGLSETIDALDERLKSVEEQGPEWVADRVVSRLLDSDRLRTLANAQAAEAVIEYFKEHPVKDGEDGKSVTMDDVSIFLDAAIAKHLLDLERRANETISKAIDKIPAPKDGVDLTEVSLEFDGERTVKVKGRTGEVTKRLPIPLWRGYWSEKVVCERGDILTHNGTAYIAIVDNPKCEPGVGKYDHEWKVFTRKGRDGKDGRNGVDRTKPVDLKKKPEDD